MNRARALRALECAVKKIAPKDLDVYQRAPDWGDMARAVLAGLEERGVVLLDKDDLTP